MFAHRLLSVWMATLIQTAVFNGGFVLPAVSAALQIITTEFDNCPHLTDVQVSFENMTMRMDPETKILYFSAILDVKRQLDDDIKLKMFLKKCTDGREEHTCTLFLNATMNPCKHLPTIWQEIVQHTEGFPTTCPVPVGKYVVTNAPVDTSEIQEMQTVPGYWRFEIHGELSDGTDIFCTFVALEINKIKKKKPVNLED